MIKVIVDTLGGDNSPEANIEGAKTALKNIRDLEVVLVGDEKVIGEKISDFSEKDRISVVHAADVISCNDKPTEAIRTKKDSSMYKCFEILKTDDSANAMVSTGSTGALLAGAVLKLGRIKGVKRPAFCPVLPTMNGKVVGLCDSGANVDCDSLYLKQFALMGSLYLKAAYGIENPKVALLNVGVEEEKGDELRKETFALLKSCDKINFCGNMEARDLLKGDFDLVVCDGFSGNVLLKSTEGACMEVLKLLKNTFRKNLKTKLCALFLKKDVYAIKDTMDYNNYGGAVLLGAAKTIVKGHGSSKALSVYRCIEQAYNMEKKGLRKSISEIVTDVE